MEAILESIGHNQMVVTFDDVSVMPQVKKALALMRGVKCVSIPKARKRKSGIDVALDDAKAGRVTRWNSVDEMFDSILK